MKNIIAKKGFTNIPIASSYVSKLWGVKDTDNTEILIVSLKKDRYTIVPKGKLSEEYNWEGQDLQEFEKDFEDAIKMIHSEKTW